MLAHQRNLLSRRENSSTKLMAIARLSFSNDKTLNLSGVRHGVFLSLGSGWLNETGLKVLQREHE